MKYHLEYSNGKKLSIAGYLRALGKTQNIEDWKKNMVTSGTLNIKNGYNKVWPKQF